jgi:hypothetical protein
VHALSDGNAQQHAGSDVGGELHQLQHRNVRADDRSAELHAMSAGNERQQQRDGSDESGRRMRAVRGQLLCKQSGEQVVRTVSARDTESGGSSVLYNVSRRAGARRERRVRAVRGWQVCAVRSDQLQLERGGVVLAGGSVDVLAVPARNALVRNWGRQRDHV